jgi:eukaryotic-like serine/threonine-protein kinase
MRHVQAPPPAVRRQRPDLPSAVEAVVQRTLAKDPAARFRTAGALAQALEQAWPAPPVASPLLPSPNRHNRTTIQAGAPASAAAALRHLTPPLRAMFASVLRAYAGRRPLPIQVGVLTVLLLCSALLALGSVGARADVRDTQTPATTATVLPTATTIVQPAAIATALPTATPAPPPTATPVPQPSVAPVAPAVAPVAAPAVPPVAAPALPAGSPGEGQGNDEHGKGRGKGKGEGKGKGQGRGK